MSSNKVIGMTRIEQFRREHQGKSRFELVVLREQVSKWSEEYFVILALLEEMDADQHKKTRCLTKIGIAVTAIGVVVAIWLHFHPVAISSPSTSIQTPRPTSAPGAKP